MQLRRKHVAAITATYYCCDDQSSVNSDDAAHVKRIDYMPATCASDEKAVCAALRVRQDTTLTPETAFRRSL